MTRTRRATGGKGRTPAAKRSASLPTKPDPPLAELRRRATQRLRQIACLLAIVRAEYLAAAADCHRLQAAQAGADMQATAESEAVEQLTARFTGVRDKVKQMESALTAAHDRNRELQARIAKLERGRDRQEVAAAAEAARLTHDIGDPTGASAPTHAAGWPKTDTESLLRFLDELADMLPLPSGSSSR